MQFFVIGNRQRLPRQLQAIEGGKGNAIGRSGTIPRQRRSQITHALTSIWHTRIQLARHDTALGQLGRLLEDRQITRQHASRRAGKKHLARLAHQKPGLAVDLAGDPHGRGTEFAQASGRQGAVGARHAALVVLQRLQQCSVCQTGITQAGPKGLAAGVGSGAHAAPPVGAAGRFNSISLKSKVRRYEVPWTCPSRNPR